MYQLQWVIDLMSEHSQDGNINLQEFIYDLIELLRQGAE